MAENFTAYMNAFGRADSTNWGEKAYWAAFGPDKSYRPRISAEEFWARQPKEQKWRRRIPDAMRERIWQHCLGVCAYCQTLMVRGALDWPPDQFTIDHVVPVSKGGSDDIENLVGACRACNTAKAVS